MKKPKLVNIWNPKRKQGKSMLAINLAGAATKLGLKPGVIFQVGRDPTDLPEEPLDVDIIFVDHPHKSLLFSDNSCLLIPLILFKNRYPTHIHAFETARSDLFEIIDRIDENIITVLIEGHKIWGADKEIRQYLKAQGAFFIPYSNIFIRSSHEYITIFDKVFDRVCNISKRRYEMSQILDRLL